MVFNRAEGFAGSPWYSSTGLTASAVLRSLSGGSQTVLARPSDGFLNLVKMMASLQDPNVLTNEVLGNQLARYLELSVPNWRPIEFSKNCLESKLLVLAAVQKDGR